MSAARPSAAQSYALLLLKGDNAIVCGTTRPGRHDPGVALPTARVLIERGWAQVIDGYDGQPHYGSVLSITDAGRRA